MPKASEMCVWPFILISCLEVLQAYSYIYIDMYMAMHLLQALKCLVHDVYEHLFYALF